MAEVKQIAVICTGPEDFRVQCREVGCDRYSDKFAFTTKAVYTKVTDIASAQGRFFNSFMISEGAMSDGRYAEILDALQITPSTSRSEA